MEISRLTVLHIQGNEPFVYTIENAGKFGFVVGTFHIDPLISTKCIYDSKEIANDEGVMLVERLKRLDVLAGSVGCEEGK